MGRKLQIKRGAKAALPALAVAELAMTTDEKTLYYGTGAENIPVARETHSHTAADVGAAPSSHVGDASHASVAEKNAWNGKAAGDHTHTAADVGALPVSGGVLTGNLTIKGSGNYGTRINLGDGDYVHIAEPSDDKLELKGSNVDIVATSLTKNGVPLLVGFGPTIITVPVGNWSDSAPFTQIVSVGGVTASDTHLHLYTVDIADKAARDLYNKAVGCLAPEADTVSGGVKLTCREKKPETTFQMSLEGARG